MDRQFALTQRYTIVEETKNISPILKKPTLKHVMVLRKWKEKFYFLVYNFNVRHPGCVFLY